MIEPIITAIISTYNSERFIHGRMDNLVSQSVLDMIEIIVIDSASSEKESSIIQGFQELFPEKIKYIRTHERETVYASWNRGIEMAKGKYITNANSDDRLRKDAIEQLYNALERNPEYALAYGDSLISLIENEVFDDNDGRIFFRWPDFDRTLLFKTCFVGPHPMWRKELHEKHGLFDESFTSAGDYEFWLRISKNEKFLHVPQVLGLYYLNPKGIENSDKSLSFQESERARRRHWPKSQGEIPKASQSFLHMANRIESGNETPLVSVIIPTKNRPELLLRSLGSVFDQEYQHFEVLVINDGDSDLQKLLKMRFNDNRLRYFKNQKKGVSSARNLGLSEAIGKYISYLDDDDIYYANHLKTLVDALETKKINFAYTDAVKSVQKKEEDSWKIQKRCLEYSYEFDIGRLLISNYIPTICIMHNKLCIDKAGAFDENLVTHEDWDLWIRIACYYDFMHIKKITAEYSMFINEKINTTVTKRKNFLDSMETIYNRYDFLAPTESVKQLKKDNLVKLQLLIQRLDANS
jgi:O-antigen biosynthesis protein